MRKSEFVSQLESRLSGLPQEDVNERLSFYTEMIDDRVEEGATEEEAVAAIGSVDDVYEEIISDISLAKIVKKKLYKERKLKTWEIVLIVLGSPIWLSILIAVLAVVFSGYVVLWSLIVSMWAVGVSIVLSSVGILIGAFIFMIKGYALTSVAVIGAALFLLGFSFFFLFGCKLITKGLLFVTKKITLLIKYMIVGKESSI